MQGWTTFQTGYPPISSLVIYAIPVMDKNTPDQVDMWCYMWAGGGDSDKIRKEHPTCNHWKIHTHCPGFEG